MNRPHEIDEILEFIWPMYDVHDPVCDCARCLYAQEKFDALRVPKEKGQQ